MVVATPTKERWETRAYRKIVAVGYRDRHLVVTFADGDEVDVATARFDNPHWIAQQPDWPRVHLGPDHIVVPTATDEEGIPWTAIRLMTDPEFAADWGDREAAVARDLGCRFREIREERGISVHDLATRAGVALRVVENVESGHHDGDFRVTDRLLAAMDLDRDALIAAADVGGAGEAGDDDEPDDDETARGPRSPR